MENAPHPTQEDAQKARTIILLLDDNPDSLPAFQTILQDPDYHLLQASSGPQALEVLDEKEVGLIILDVRMPVLDGLNTVSLIRARHPSLPIIFLSRARLEPSHLDRALSLGAVDYLTKPVEPVVIKAKVRQVVDLHRKGKTMEAKLDELYSDEKVDILVVCGDSSAVLDLQSVLQRLVGARVQTTSSCEDALRMLLRHEYCLVLIDVNLPVMDSYELASRIRSHEGLKAIPIIFASTTAQTGEEILRGYAAGASDFISVPCPTEIFLAKVGAITNMARRSRLLTRQLRKIEDLNRNLQETNRLLEAKHREAEATHNLLLHTEKLSAIGKLSASIAHELNNPLQGILFFLQGLKRQGLLENEDKDLLETIIAESNRIKELVRNLQDFNRPSLGKRQPMDVHGSLDALLLLLRSDLRKRQITIIRHYAADLPRIIAVTDQIKQVFLNLLTNAMEACGRGGGEIAISSWHEDARVAIAIKDTGLGIAKEHMEHIFQPFFTTREDKGTGLGLSISHDIIARHHGKIRVESQPGQGATFTILLPTGDAAGEPPSSAA